MQGGGDEDPAVFFLPLHPKVYHRNGNFCGGTENSILSTSRSENEESFRHLAKLAEHGQVLHTYNSRSLPEAVVSGCFEPSQWRNKVVSYSLKASFFP